MYYLQVSITINRRNDLPLGVWRQAICRISRESPSEAKCFMKDRLGM